MLKSMPSGATKKTKSAPKALIKLLTISAYCLLILFAIMSQNEKSTVSINGKKISVEIATSSQEKSRGLCCRESLGENSGMLFVYNASGDFPFWMKDTNIPLDMIWLDSTKKVVHLEEKVQPSSYPKTYSSPIPSKYILETNSGWVEKNAIDIGDRAAF